LTQREEQTILKARIKTLQMYLEDVFVLLKDVEEIRTKVDKKLGDFLKDIDYQDTTAIELEKRN